MASFSSLTEDEFEEFTRDVAARIIQTYWRQWVEWKASMRQKGEHEILQRLGLSLGGKPETEKDILLRPALPSDYSTRADVLLPHSPPALPSKLLATGLPGDKLILDDDNTMSGASALLLLQSGSRQQSEVEQYLAEGHGVEIEAEQRVSHDEDVGLRDGDLHSEGRDMRPLSAGTVESIIARLTSGSSLESLDLAPGEAEAVFALLQGIKHQDDGKQLAESKSAFEYQDDGVSPVLDVDYKNMDQAESRENAPLSELEHTSGASTDLPSAPASDEAPKISPRVQFVSEVEVLPSQSVSKLPTNKPVPALNLKKLRQSTGSHTTPPCALARIVTKQSAGTEARQQLPGAQSSQRIIASTVKPKKAETVVGPKLSTQTTRVPSSQQPHSKDVKPKGILKSSSTRSAQPQLVSQKVLNGSETKNGMSTAAETASLSGSEGGSMRSGSEVVAKGVRAVTPQWRNQRVAAAPQSEASLHRAAEVVNELGFEIGTKHSGLGSVDKDKALVPLHSAPYHTYETSPAQTAATSYTPVPAYHNEEDEDEEADPNAFRASHMEVRLHAASSSKGVSSQHRYNQAYSDHHNAVDSSPDAPRPTPLSASIKPMQRAPGAKHSTISISPTAVSLGDKSGRNGQAPSADQEGPLVANVSSLGQEGDNDMHIEDGVGQKAVAAGENMLLSGVGSRGESIGRQDQHSFHLNCVGKGVSIPASSGKQEHLSGSELTTRGSRHDAFEGDSISCSSSQPGEPVEQNASQGRDRDSALRTSSHDQILSQKFEKYARRATPGYAQSFQASKANRINAEVERRSSTQSTVAPPDNTSFNDSETAASSKPAGQTSRPGSAGSYSKDPPEAAKVGRSSVLDRITVDKSAVGARERETRQGQSLNARRRSGSLAASIDDASLISRRGPLNAESGNTQGVVNPINNNDAHRSTIKANTTTNAENSKLDDCVSAPQPPLEPQKDAFSEPSNAPTTSGASPNPNSSLTAEKLSVIMSYLDDVERQAEEEANAIPDIVASVKPVPYMHSAPARSLVMPPAQPSAQPQQPSVPSRAPVSRPSSALGKPMPSTLQHRAHTNSMSREAYQHSLMDLPGEDDCSVSASLDAPSMVSLGTRSAFLAETVYDGVRTRIRGLQDEMKQKDAAIMALTQERDVARSEVRLIALDAEARLGEALAAQRGELEASTRRQLAFVDRLMADKDDLRRRCTELEVALQAVNDKHERAIAKLKEGWAQELKRQREAWNTSERARKDDWVANKTQEIKDLTIKGMEGEMQKLLAKHKADVTAASQVASDDTRRQLEAAAQVHEAALKVLKERMLKDQEDAVERERLSGVARQREACERYESQLQAQRMRLVADADMRMEQMEALRKDDKRRADEALAAAQASFSRREAELLEESKREKEIVRRTMERQIEEVRAGYEAVQEGLRGAVAERAKKELAAREATMREAMMKERDTKIEAIVSRLEAESAAARMELQAEAAKREDALNAAAAKAAKEASRREARLAERFRVAYEGQQEAEARAAAAERQAALVERELAAQADRVQWLEEQVGHLKAQLAMRDEAVRGAASAETAVREEVTRQATLEREAMASRLREAEKAMAELRSLHSREMASVEARVRAAVTKKDDTIASLRDQLAAAGNQLRATESILENQRREMIGMGLVDVHGSSIFS